MTIDSIHAIAALCVGIVLIALSWLLPRDSGEYVRCTQCLKYRQACNSICPACLTPDSPTSSAPQYAYILATRTRGMHIQLLLAVGEFLICVAQCALPCLIIKNIVGNAGLPTAYGIDQNIKIAFVLLLVPTVACWYAFLGSGLRGEQSYSPARPMVFRRGTPSIFKELLSGFSFAIAQPALLWFVHPSHAGRQRRIGIHAGRWQAPARIWHRDRLLRCRIRDFLLRGALHVRHIPARTSWRIRHRPGNQRRESLT
ncbi:MAG: hypothetical protein ACLUA4_13310 [Bifidobacterium sp.]